MDLGSHPVGSANQVKSRKIFKCKQLKIAQGKKTQTKEKKKKKKRQRQRAALSSFIDD